MKKTQKKLSKWRQPDKISRILFWIVSLLKMSSLGKKNQPQTKPLIYNHKTTKNILLSLIVMHSYSTSTGRLQYTNRVTTNCKHVTLLEVLTYLKVGRKKLIFIIVPYTSSYNRCLHMSWSATSVDANDEVMRCINVHRR